MGSKTTKPVTKRGSPYAEVSKTLRPGDLVLFSGDTFFSKLIKFAEKTQIKGKVYDENLFSHIGMVVTSEILDDPRIEPGKLYILESTTGSVFSSKVPNIHGVYFDGVQVRSLDDVFLAYDQPNDTHIACAHLIKPFTSDDKSIFTEVYNTVINISYDSNIYSLASAVYPCLRPARDDIEDAVSTENWLFCSELVATILKKTGRLPDTVDPKNALPVDFLGYDRDGMPIVVELPVTYMVSPIHSIKN